MRGSVCGRAPVEPGKTREVAIEADPLTAGLDRERRQVGVGCQVADGVDSPAEIGEHGPVAATGRNDTCVGPVAETVAEVEGVTKRGWWVQRPTVGDDAHKGAENELGESEGTRVPHGTFEQVMCDIVVGLLGAVGIEQHIDVEEDHPVRSRMSASAALLFRSTPGTGAAPRKVGTR